MNQIMNCKEVQNELPSLLLDPNAEGNRAVLAHIDTCPPCKLEFAELKNTFSLLDDWTAPEPSPYFDQRMAVLLREEQAAPKMSWLESLRTRILFNTGRSFRPAVACALALVLAVSGGSVAGVHAYLHPANVEAASDAVNDLQILDRNEKAFQQMDQLLQDEDGADEAPATAPAPPTS
jgi:hypothetical protein